MAATVPILVMCSCKANHKKRMDVQPNILLADLIKGVETELTCSIGIQLKLMVDQNNWVVLQDPVNLVAKSRLKAEKVCHCVVCNVAYFISR